MLERIISEKYHNSWMVSTYHYKGSDVSYDLDGVFVENRKGSFIFSKAEKGAYYLQVKF